MGFSPAKLDGQAAAARLVSFGTYKPGLCLGAVDKAFLKPASNKVGYYTFALRAWSACPAERRHTDRDVPAGAAVFLSAGHNGYGYICISLGGDRVVATDTPSGGRVGITTISALERAWGRTFVGWTDWLMGHDIVNLGETAAAAASATKQELHESAGSVKDGKVGPIKKKALGI